MPWYLFLQDISLAVSCRLVLQIFIFGDLLDVADVLQDISLAVSGRLVLQIFIFGDLLEAAAIFQDISLAVSCRLVLQIFIFGDLLDAAVDEVGVGVYWPCWSSSSSDLSLSSLRWSSSSSLGPDHWSPMSFSLKPGLWSLTDLFSHSPPLDVSFPVRLYCWSWGKHPLWYCCQTNRWCSSCEDSWPWLSPVCWLSSWPGTLCFSNPWFGNLAYLVSELSLNSSAQLLARLMSRVTPSLIMELMLSQSALLPMLWLSAGLSMQSSSMLLPTLMALADLSMALATSPITNP